MQILPPWPLREGVLLLPLRKLDSLFFLTEPLGEPGRPPSMEPAVE